LEGPAGQVLWGLKPEATADSVISLLRTRFGNELQIERFRAELRARRRRRGESLQSLYLDVTRMVALTHPTSVPDLTRHVAKEAFINALGDDKLQIRVMDKQPATIEEALGIAGRLEAYECTLRAQGAPATEFSKGREHQEDVPRANMSTLLSSRNPVKDNSCKNNCRSCKRKLLTSKFKEKVSRLLNQLQLWQQIYLQTKPSLGPVPVVQLRDGAEAEVEVKLEVEEVGHRQSSPIATIVRPQVIGLETAGAKLKQIQSLVHQN